MRLRHMKYIDFKQPVSQMKMTFQEIRIIKLSLILRDIEEGHLLIENVVNIFFVTPFGIVAQSSRLL
jgi:hypothetical protein